SPGAVSRVVFRAVPVSAALEELEGRPLRSPSQVVCPSPAGVVSGYSGPVVGEPPVVLAGSGTFPIGRATPENGLSLLSAAWFVSRDERGPILIRGVGNGADSAPLFGGAATPSLRLLVGTDRPT